MTEQHRIPLLPGDESAAHYGITHRSAFVYDTRVYGGAPTRVNVWSNTGRPNPDKGKSLGDTLRNGNVLTEYSLPGTATREYLDPHNAPTDDPVSILLTPESTVMCADTRMNTGQPGSGQVFARNIRLGDGDTADLIYPEGTVQRVTLHFPRHHNNHGYATIGDESQ